MEALREKFVFIPFLDELGNDIGHSENRNLENLTTKALNTTGCVGFNTLGFLKSKISNLQPSRYFGENDGIYILRHEYIQKPVDPIEEMREVINNILAVDTIDLLIEDKLKNKRNSHFMNDLSDNDPKITNPIFMAINPESNECIEAVLGLGFNEIIVFSSSDLFAKENAVKYISHKNVTVHKYGSLDTVLGITLDSKIEGVTFLVEDIQSLDEILTIVRKFNHPDNVMIISNITTDCMLKIEKNLSSLHPRTNTYIFGTNCVSYNLEK